MIKQKTKEIAKTGLEDHKKHSGKLGTTYNSR